MQKNVAPIKCFVKTLTVPPDKSISHRAVMLGAVANGRTYVHNALMSDDIHATVDCMAKLGAECSVNGGEIIVNPKRSFKNAELYAGNSGTTMRLLSGILAGQAGQTFNFSGDESLSKRPMDRVSAPLTEMGADITLSGRCCPMKISGRDLKGIDYTLKQNSAQVKSAILFAGLYASGETKVTETAVSRDHSERMLKLMGADISKINLTTTVRRSALNAIELTVPGDISSAAFPLVLAAAKKGNRVTIKNVSLNPTRTGILDVLKMCGAALTTESFHDVGEPFGDITVSGGNLKPFSIGAEIAPRLIDEIPVLAVLACFIEGTSIITGAEELKVKESNRIDAVVGALRAFGADIEPLADGMKIYGKGYLKGGCQIETYNDHRLAMSMAVAAALSEKGAVINDAECVSVSYPGFYDIIN